ncbi:MAG: hypothetical protein KAU90_07200 [Sulfurovaceae bacterium]|nr:hypothetical protein [Sulfurovaceae bacterium]
MKKILYTCIAILALIEGSYASTRGDVKILEATENIQSLSQKIAIDYLFFYKNSENSILKKRLYKNIDNLQFYIKEIRDIADKKKGIYTQNLLNYFTYIIEQIKKLPNERIDISNIEYILKYSEVLLEGTKSIAKEHKYNFSKEEKMLMLSKEIIYLLKRANKYYLASYIGLNSNTNYENMKKAIKDINSRLEIMNSYNYPIKVENKLNEINVIWNRNKEFFYKAEELSIPYILSESTEYMENLLIEIEQYHKKNL